MAKGRIAIVGKAGTHSLAPWADKSWEIWTMPWVIAQRATALFDPHTQQCWDEFKLEDLAPDEFKAGRAIYRKQPVFTYPDRFHLYGNPQPLPMDALRKIIPQAFMENTIAIMLAMAVLANRVKPGSISEVAIYGVHMRGIKEYEEERASVLYICGLLEGMGVKVTVAPGAPLFMSQWEAGIYGLGGKRRMINPQMGALPRLSEDRGKNNDDPDDKPVHERFDGTGQRSRELETRVRGILRREIEEAEQEKV